MATPVEVNVIRHTALIPETGERFAVARYFDQAGNELPPEASEYAVRCQAMSLIDHRLIVVNFPRVCRTVH